MRGDVKIHHPKHSYSVARGYLYSKNCMSSLDGAEFWMQPVVRTFQNLPHFNSNSLL